LQVRSRLALGGGVTMGVNQLSFSTDSLVESGHFLYHASVLTRRPALKAGETILAILLEAENSRCSAGPNLGN
jgi:hypothetical protein